MEKKSKSYYLMIISKKAQLPNASSKLQREFAISSDCLPKIFALPFKVALEPYVRSFQYKVLNSILYTNDKLYKFGFSQSNKCTFCNSDLESLYHLLYICPLSRNFLEIFWSLISKEEIHLSLQDVILGITTRPCPLLNYLLLIAKMYVWDCGRNTTSPNIVSFKNKAQIKYETELFIARNTCNMEFLKKKWMDFRVG